MTKDHNFKRRVRARMERTGESYTTARAHLLGRDRPPNRVDRPQHGFSIVIPDGWTEVATTQPGELIRLERGSASELRHRVARVIERFGRRGWELSRYVAYPAAEILVMKVQDASLDKLAAGRVAGIEAVTTYRNFVISPVEDPDKDAQVITYGSNGRPAWRCAEYLLRRRDGGHAFIVGLGATPSHFDEETIRQVAATFEIKAPGHADVT